MRTKKVSPSNLLVIQNLKLEVLKELPHPHIGDHSIYNYRNHVQCDLVGKHRENLQATLQSHVHLALHWINFPKPIAVPINR